MNFDPEKLIVVFVIAMIVLGPKRLPQAARTAARWLAEVRRYTSGVRNEVRQLLDEDFQEGTAFRDELRNAIAEPRQAIEAGAREANGWPNEQSPNGQAPAGAYQSGPAYQASSGSAVAVPDDPNLN